jgi:hypothetical protein
MNTESTMTDPTIRTEEDPLPTELHTVIEVTRSGSDETTDKEVFVRGEGYADRPRFLWVSTLDGMKWPDELVVTLGDTWRIVALPVTVVTERGAEHQ